MKNIKVNLPLTSAILAIVLMTVIAGGLLIIETRPALAQSAQAGNSYAIYLSPGPTTGVPYDGYHVTIAGFLNKQFTTAMKNDVKKAWQKVNGGQPFSLKNKGGTLIKNNNILGYGFYFKSLVLDNLATELKSYKVFKGVKSGNWHVTLYTNSLTGAKNLIAKLEQLPWRLWEVRRHIDNKGKRTYQWTLII